MNKLKNKIADFLTSNNAWIYSVVLTVFSFMWVLTFVKSVDSNLPQSMVYLHVDKWMLFFKLLGVLHLLFLPFIIFAILRKKLFRHSTKLIHYVTWVFAYIIYPFVCFGFLEVQNLVNPVAMTSEIIISLAIVLVLVEIITNPDSQLPTHVNFDKFKRKFKPEWILVAIGFVLCSVHLIFLRFDDYESNILSGFIQTIIPLLIIYAFYFINYNFLVKSIYRSKGVLYYLFAFSGLVILFYIPMLVTLYSLPVFELIFEEIPGKEWVGENAPSVFNATHSGLVRTAFLYTIPVVILIQWLKQDQQINKLSKEKSETELTMLKQQINPHFFFNTLNNVYSMSLTKDEQTPEAILQLSDLMRYVIYKGQEETVALSDEIKYIEDYLELQKMRLHQNFDLKFDKHIENLDLQITPLLFIILIENAFKHGIEGAENDSYLHLSLTQHGQQLTFTCVNSLEESDVPKDTGLGLTNLKRRLELVYPERYTLATSKNTSTYTAELQIAN